MPLLIRDFECKECGAVAEDIVDCETTEILCRSCGGNAVKIMSLSSFDYTKESPEWIKSVREVVNKRGGPHCQNFLKDPTRENYRVWKKAENVRHLVPGEKDPADKAKEKADATHKRLVGKVKEKSRQRRAISIESR